MPTVLVLECPWATMANDPACQSVSYFIDGVCRSRENSKMAFSHFYDAASLEYSLKYICQPDKTNQLIYVSSHGTHDSIVTNDLNENAENIFAKDFFNIVNEKNVKFSGILLGCCDIGQSLNGEIDCNANWIFGYRCSVDWFKSTMIDCAVLRYALGGNNANPNATVQKVLVFFRRAISLFSRDLVLCDENQTILRDAVVLLIKGENDIFVDYTDEMFGN